MLAPVYTSRFFVMKFNCFVYDSYLSIRLPRVAKCVTSGDVANGVAKCDPRSTGIRGKAVDLSYRRYVVRILTNKANISI